MGSAPVTNMQPRLGNPGAAQMRPGGADPRQMPPPAAMPGQQPQMPHPVMGGMPPPGQQQAGANPQQLATALTQLKGGVA